MTATLRCPLKQKATFKAADQQFSWKESFVLAYPPLGEEKNIQVPDFVTGLRALPRESRQVGKQRPKAESRRFRY
jgi:hypothetical protein